jgi:hypothetical protein
MQSSRHWRKDNDNPALANFLKLLSERYPLPCAGGLLRRTFAKARSVAMNRASIGATSFAGFGIDWPVSRARRSA